MAKLKTVSILGPIFYKHIKRPNFACVCARIIWHTIFDFYFEKRPYKCAMFQSVVPWSLRTAASVCNNLKIFA